MTATTVDYNTWPKSCAPGSYGPVTGLYSQDMCTECPQGKYCSGGQGSPDGDCDATFYCPIGSSAQNGYSNEHVIGTTVAGLCPKGFYCEAGAEAPVPCPKGKYGQTAGLSAEDGCLDCPPGKYCDEVAMTDDTFLIDGKDCDVGYYCTGGATIPYPTDKDTMGGDICQQGFYCELGSEV